MLSDKSHIYLKKHGDFIDKLSDCISSVGTGSFYLEFSRLLKETIGNGNFVVLEMSSDYSEVMGQFSTYDNNQDLFRYISEKAHRKDSALKCLINRADKSKGDIVCLNYSKESLKGSYINSLLSYLSYDDAFLSLYNKRSDSNPAYVSIPINKNIRKGGDNLLIFNQYCKVISSLAYKQASMEKKMNTPEKEAKTPSCLSKREMQVFKMLTSGHTTKSIAQELGIANTSVITYKNRIFKKLNINTKLQLVKMFEEKPLERCR